MPLLTLSSAEIFQTLSMNMLIKNDLKLPFPVILQYAYGTYLFQRSFQMGNNFCMIKRKLKIH